MVAVTGPAGWRRVGPDPAIAAWAEAALPAARAALAAPGGDWRHGGTWFVGVDALPNAPDGSILGTPFPWGALPLPPEPLHRAQLSTTRPGYPQPDPGETEAAFRFRRNRAAAHLDGLLPVGPDRRRMVREPHAWILGLPLTEAGPEAAPLTVWEGSHRLIGPALARAMEGHPPGALADLDITEAYQAARAQAFATCRRIDLPARPGEGILLHRHLLHGVAPWAEGATAAPEGRIIAYLRPLLPSVADWLANP